MSRLARKPIIVPQGVTVKESDGVFSVHGPKGELTVRSLPQTNVAIDAQNVSVKPADGEQEASRNTGTLWSLLTNAVEGVTNGFSKVLEIEGVGYKGAMEGKTLVLSLGFVNPVKVVPPEGVTIAIEKNTITVSGASKEAVGQTAAFIRAQKKPEPYKGKGIHYKGEVIRRKVGKKAGATATA